MFGIKSDVRKYEKVLRRMRAKAIPFAVKASLNATAEEAWGYWKTNVRDTMTLRNKWTEGSIKLYRARSNKIARMNAIIGSKRDYLGLNETGGRARGTGKHGLMVPTNRSRTGRSYRKTVRRPMRRKSFRVEERTGRGRKQRNAIQIAQAAENAGTLAMLELKGGGFGYFSVKGDARRKKGKRSATLHAIWIQKKRSQKIKKNPAMRRATKRALKNLDRHYVAALKREIYEVVRRSGLKRG